MMRGIELRTHVWVYSCRSVFALSNVLIQIALVNILPIVEYAHIVRALSLNAVFVALLLFGLPVSYVRQLPSDEILNPRDAARTLSSAVLVTLLAAITLFLVATYIAERFFGLLSIGGEGLAPFQIWCSCAAVSGVIAEVLRTHGRFASYAAVLLTPPLWLLGFLFTSIDGHLVASNVLQYFAAGYGLSSIVALYFLVRSIGIGATTRNDLTSLARVSSGVVGTTILVVLLSQLDVLIASYLYAPEQVALYGFATKVAHACLFFHFASVSFVPALTKAETMSGRERVLRRSSLFVALITIAVTGAVALTFDPIVTAVASAHYLDAKPYFLILAVVLVVNALTGCKGALLWALGHTGSYARLLLFAVPGIAGSLYVGGLTLDLKAFVVLVAVLMSSYLMAEWVVTYRITGLNTSLFPTFSLRPT